MYPANLFHDTLHRTIYISAWTGSMAIQLTILLLYTDLSVENAIIDSVLSMSLLGSAGYALSYAIESLQNQWLHASLAILVQILCLTVCGILLSILQVESYKWFLGTVPLRAVYGLLLWTILIQYFLTHKSDNENEPDDVPEATDSPEVQQEAPQHPSEVWERISVKEGSRIDIIEVQNIHYIEAAGDYINLVTEQGQYIKELTMKAVEEHLPADDFVRIHRSYIVNIRYISRIELFGKETYRLLLRNGTALRISSNGYRQLKSALKL